MNTPISDGVMEALAGMALTTSDYETHWRASLLDASISEPVLQKVQTKRSVYADRLIEEEKIPAELVHAFEAALILAVARVSGQRPNIHREQDASFADIKHALSFTKEYLKEKE